MLSPVDLRDLKPSLHLAESRHFGRNAASDTSAIRFPGRIQRLEEDLGQALFTSNDNHTVTLTEAGERAAVFA